jgi:hypothetical protein
MPDFISPFKWRLVAQLSDGYELRDLDLVAGLDSETAVAMAARTRSVRVPNQWTPSVVRAAEAPVAHTFLGFSRFPAARSFVAPDGTATVRWSDMRFATGALERSLQARGNLFGAVVVLAPDGSVRTDRLGP